MTHPPEQDLTDEVRDIENRPVPATVLGGFECGPQSRPSFSGAAGPAANAAAATVGRIREVESQVR